MPKPFSTTKLRTNDCRSGDLCCIGVRSEWGNERHRCAECEQRLIDGGKFVVLGSEDQRRAISDYAQA